MLTSVSGACEGLPAKPLTSVIGADMRSDAPLDGGRAAARATGLPGVLRRSCSRGREFDARTLGPDVQLGPANVGPAGHSPRVGRALIVGSALGFRCLREAGLVREGRPAPT